MNQGVHWIWRYLGTIIILQWNFSLLSCIFYAFVLVSHMLFIVLIYRHPVILCPIQASSPLQVKYADGELERLGVMWFSLFYNILLKMVLINCAGASSYFPSYCWFPDLFPHHLLLFHLIWSRAQTFCGYASKECLGCWAFCIIFSVWNCQGPANFERLSANKQRYNFWTSSPDFFFPL